MSTTGRGRHSVLRIFKGRGRERTDTTRRAVLFRPPRTLPPGVRVSRRVEWGAHGPASGARGMRSTPRGARARARHNRESGRRRSAGVSRARALAAPPIHAGPRPESIGGPARRRSTSDRGASPAPIRFPPDNFKHSLTSFSSFPRGTCSLSVSRPYLALDGIHRPIWAAFPNNPTRRQRLVVRQGPGTTGLSPSPAPPSRGLGPGPPLRTLLQTTIRTTEPPDSKAGLFPVRSPLLGESL
ncbi:hypothetical protein RND71_019082 [Anisodus tanguticus]|uniref:Protein TAR1 n=1 Tax=Anisodus tanguticus TaxID=243964 RepID=A0AAE1VH30_9SOLA|nr:hypothetical protein RND71_019082 [Anisodus tanguticus]